MIGPSRLVPPLNGGRQAFKNRHRSVDRNLLARIVARLPEAVNSGSVCGPIRYVWRGDGTASRANAFLPPAGGRCRMRETVFRQSRS